MRLFLMGTGLFATALCVSALIPAQTSANAARLNSASLKSVSSGAVAASLSPNLTNRSYKTMGETGELPNSKASPASMPRRYQDITNSEPNPVRDKSDLTALGSVGQSPIAEQDKVASITPGETSSSPSEVLETPDTLPTPRLKPVPKRSGRAVNLAQIERRIRRLMREKQMAGLSVAIVENGELTFAKGFGETQKGTGERVTEDTIFRWASVSKGVAAATLLSLADEGYLALEHPVEAFHTTLQLPKHAHNVTVEDLLSHKVGIVRNAYDRKIEEGASPKDVRASMKDLKNLCDPGTCHGYQNVIFDTATEIAESATGLPYKSIVSERLFKPLKMTSASTTYEGLIRSKSWAKPHTRKGRPISTVKPNYYRVPAAAGVNSSVVDLSKWMVAQMDGDNGVVSNMARVEMQTPRVNTPRESRLMRRKYTSLKDSSYGLGWRIYDYSGHKVVGHRGGVEGYRALVLFDPELKTGVAMMWNSGHSDPIGLQMEIMDQVYGNRTRDWMRLNR